MIYANIRLEFETTDVVNGPANFSEIEDGINAALRDFELVVSVPSRCGPKRQVCKLRKRNWRITSVGDRNENFPFRDSVRTE